MTEGTSGCGVSWESQLLELLSSNISLEYSLRRDLLFASSGKHMPFPLREDFLNANTRYWPIWCSWNHWVSLTELPQPNGIRGIWKRGHELLCLQGHRAHWLSVDASSRPAKVEDECGTSAACAWCTLSDDTTCFTWLEGDQLRWADGDSWTRVSLEELQDITASLNSLSICMLLRSVGDARNFQASIIENQLQQLREKGGSDSKIIQDGYAELLRLVPINEELWRTFQHAVANLPQLLQQRRRRYTVDFIRQHFHVLYIGHSFLHLNSRILADEDEEATDALQSQPWVNQNLRKNPLCNDVGELHRDDLAEDLFTLPEERLPDTLPLEHFDVIWLRNCPEPLTAHALQVFTAILKAGGLLIAMPAHLNPSVQLPKALSLEAAWELAGGVFMANHGAIFLVASQHLVFREEALKRFTSFCVRIAASVRRRCLNSWDHLLLSQMVCDGTNLAEVPESLSSACKEASSFASARLLDLRPFGAKAALEVLPLPRCLFGVYRDLQVKVSASCRPSSMPGPELLRIEGEPAIENAGARRRHAEAVHEAWHSSRIVAVCDGEASISWEVLRRFPSHIREAESDPPLTFCSQRLLRASSVEVSLLSSLGIVLAIGKVEVSVTWTSRWCHPLVSPAT
ncbi:unnamed protein product [Durusdinium trenchii]|uniref:Uncharacterized protein n=1 Tax=Durusdinium trenchii TaxID=1381693 RepID=A0ABP0MUJ7_9DINO